MHVADQLGMSDRDVCVDHTKIYNHDSKLKDRLKVSGVTAEFGVKQAQVNRYI